MYSINDRTSAIKEVQMYLIKIGYGDEIIPSGEFDTYTELAVKSFQKRMEIEESGIVNYQTHTLLKEEYQKSAIKDMINKSGGPGAYFPIKLGDFGEHIPPINSAISYILNHFGIHNDVQNGKFFSKESERATLELQKMMQLNSDGIIDQVFYARIMRIYRDISAK